MTDGASLLRRYPIALISGAGVLLGGLLHLLRVSNALSVFEVIAIGGGIPLIFQTLRNMARGTFHVDVVATLAILGCAALGQWMAGALVVLMQSGGEALEDYGLRRANRNLDNLLRRAPSVAHRLVNGEFEKAAAADLVIGDVLLIRPGDIIPADGVVLQGSGNVDEAALTGEPVPLKKLPGDAVFSGTINLSGDFQVRTTRSASQSKYELIVRMVQRAQGERAPINRLANIYTPWFTLLTLGTVAIVLALTGDRMRALAVLVVATPCPLIIATPLAVLSAINRAAALNIIVKSGACVEQAGQVKTVVFDKTGTLTVGTPSLAESRVLPAASANTHSDLLLQYAANVEILSTHVLAGAVVGAARRRGLSVTPATEVREAPGSGLAGTTCGKRVSIGSIRYLQSQGVAASDEASKLRSELGSDGKTVAFIGIDNQLAGLLTFEDRVRPESANAIRQLIALGIERIVMLTGDAQETAKVVCEQVGINEVKWHLQPEEKLEAVKQLAANGPVMMVGDGINDAPALAAAAVGVAMGGYGAGIASDAADVVITVENLERVADAISIGRQMVSVARAGILFGIGASCLLMVFASLGMITPSAGALLQEAIDLAAILNALRAG